jgi:hypothetical protein
MLPDVLAGFVQHAVVVKEKRLADEESAKAWRVAEARRAQKAAFEGAEKRRVEFADAIYDQLIERDKWSAVLAHLETAVETEAHRVTEMLAWLRRRIAQIDALVSPQFLDISARAAKLKFVEETAEQAADASTRYIYYPAIKLQLWKIDEEKGQATSINSVEWMMDAIGK